MSPSPLFRLFFYSFVLLLTTALPAQITPLFLDAPPPDTTVNCASNAPIPVQLRAVVLLQGSVLVDTISVNSRDSLLPGSTGCTGEILRIWEARDGVGSNRRTQRITYLDDVAPNFARPPDAMISCTEPLPPNPDVTGRPTGLSDNCQSAAVLVVRFTDRFVTDPTCPRDFFIQRTWSVRDTCGRVRSRLQTITINNDGSTVALTDCPQDQVLTTDAGDCSAILVLPLPTITGGCPNPNDTTAGLTLTYSINGETSQLVDLTDSLRLTLPQGQSTVSLVATDCAGGSDECLVNYTVTDREAPILTCPPNRTIDLPATACTQEFTLTPPDITDNCEAFQLTNRAPSNAPDSLFTFIFSTEQDTFLAQPLQIAFPPAPPAIQDSVDIALTLRGNFASTTSTLDVLLVNGQQLASAITTGNDCETTQDFLFRLSATDYLAATEPGGGFTLTLQPSTGSDGLRSCGTVSNANGRQVDGQTYATARLTYRTRNLTYQLTRATDVGPVTIADPGNLPAVTFNQGVTNVTYRSLDAAGNTGLCVTTVTIRDVTPPRPVCRSVVIDVDPAVTTPVTIDPTAIAGNSQDVCGITTFTADPTTLTCDMNGRAIPVRVTVSDESGNNSDCNVPIRIRLLPPAPSAEQPICGGETLRLFANPPTPTSSVGASPYTFRWFGPTENLVSTQENPELPQISAEASGAYRVEITGPAGCTSVGVVNVAISPVPAAPRLTVASEVVCRGDAVELSTLSSYSGPVIYRWYRGVPANRTLLGETTTRSFTTTASGAGNEATYFVEVTQDGCTSAPSDLRLVRSPEQPRIDVTARAVSICAGETAQLVATGPSGLTYVWTGPDGTTFPGRVLRLPNTNMGDNGTYRVVGTAEGGCPSEPVSVTLTIRPLPAPVSLSGNSAVCPGGTLRLTATANDAEEYQFVSPTGAVTTSTNATLTVTNATTAVEGDWRVRVRRNGCLSEAGPAFRVRLSEQPIATATATPTPICVGNTLQLVADPAGPGARYRWEGPGGIVSDQRILFVPNIRLADAGLYRLTVTNEAGCSATTSTQVAVQPGLAITTINVVGNACLQEDQSVVLSAAVAGNEQGNELSYFWEGPTGRTSNNATFTIPNPGPAVEGVYRLVVENEAGCRSPQQTLNLQFDLAPARLAQPFTSTGDYQLCVGEVLQLRTESAGAGIRYRWRGPNGLDVVTTTAALEYQIPDGAAAGDYTVTALREDCNGPTSVARRVSVTTLPAIAVAVDQPVCSGGDLQLRATAVANLNYRWTGPNGFTAAVAEPLIRNASPEQNSGTYTLVVERDGCEAASLTIDVNVRPLPTQPVVDRPAAVCIDEPGAALILTTTPETTQTGATYTWRVRGTGQVLGTTTGSEPLNVMDFTPFADQNVPSVSVQASVDGCPSMVSIPRTVLLNRTFGQRADAGSDTSVCAGQYQLRAVAPSSGSGRWTQVQGPGEATLVSPTNPQTIVANLVAGPTPYEFVWSLSNGACMDFNSDTVRISVRATEAADAGANQLICPGAPARLAAISPTGAGNEGRWSQTEAQRALGIRIADATDPVTAVTGLLPGNIYTFTWSVSGECGTTIDEVAINVTNPMPAAGPDQTVCNLTATTALNARAVTAGSTGRWFAANGTEVDFVDANSPGTRVNDLQLGDNRLVWEIDDGQCGALARDTIIITYRRPPAPADDTYDVEFQSSIDFDPLENDESAEDVAISFGALMPNRGSLEDNGDGTYTFVAPANFVGEVSVRYATSSAGCSEAEALITFVVGEETRTVCEVPNIFTPNGDGVNDFFIIPCLLDEAERPNNEVVVYNQWGDEVFRSRRPYRNDWDGNYQGGELPVGTYFYLVNLGDGSPTLTGHVRIER